MSSTMHELSREECLRLLAANGVGRLAVSGKDAPVIRPVNYAFDEPSQSVARTRRRSRSTGSTGTRAPGGA